MYLCTYQVRFIIIYIYRGLTIICSCPLDPRGSGIFTRILVFYINVRVVHLYFMCTRGKLRWNNYDRDHSYFNQVSTKSEQRHLQGSVLGYLPSLPPPEIRLFNLKTVINCVPHENLFSLKLAAVFSYTFLSTFESHKFKLIRVFKYCFILKQYVLARFILNMKQTQNFSIQYKNETISPYNDYNADCYKINKSNQINK